MEEIKTDTKAKKGSKGWIISSLLIVGFSGGALFVDLLRKDPNALYWAIPLSLNLVTAIVELRKARI